MLLLRWEKLFAKMHRRIMTKAKRANFIKRPVFFAVITVFFLLIAAAALLLSNASKDSEAKSPTFPTVYFEGYYRIGEGEWQEVVRGEHIPANKGDVTLRGTFHMYLDKEDQYLGPVEAGMPMSFYMYHIGITVYEKDTEPHVMDNENPLYGVSACGEMWIAYALSNNGDEEVEIVIHNPHSFGNETAIDEFLSNISIWMDADLDREIISEGSFQRNSATLFIVIAFAFLGTALFSSLLHIKNSRYIWFIGASVLLAGIYLLYSATGASIWNANTSVNTTMVCLSAIFYMLFLSGLATSSLNKTARIGVSISVILCIFDLIVLLTSLVFNVYVYDTLWIWGVVQGTLGAVLCGLLIYEAFHAKGLEAVFHIVLMLPFVAYILDLIAIAVGLWRGGRASSYVFVGAFMFALVFVLQVVPQSINAAAKAKELEAEKNALDAALAKSRISTMISQIRPHFIYNTLGTIEQLCDIDPPKAGELVHNFAKYLRGNFGELDNPRPILMSREMEHVKYYVSIESIRFPDMTFEFEMNSLDFEIPALTVQPIVENAIKHGLMKLPEGGSVKVVSFEDEEHYFISVEDNGVGFDTGLLIDEREHVGLRNIRGRLEAMVNGTLEIESTIGVGTKVLIKIPKEENR